MKPFLTISFFEKSSCLFLGILLITAYPANAQLAAGQSIGIDFDDGGATPGSGSETNFLIILPADSPGGFTARETTDTTGASTNGVTVDLADFSGGPSQGEMGEGNLGFGAEGTGDYTGTLFSDLSFNDGFFFRIDVTLEITFNGLDNNLVYDVAILPTGPVTQDNAVEFAINGGELGSAGSATYNSVRTDDILTPFILEAQATADDGTLTITLSTPSVPVGVAALSITAISTSTIDIDSDGLIDDWELSWPGITQLSDLDGTLAAGSGPGSGTGDFDGDGLSDLDEFNGGSDSTNPTNIDTDNDTLSDLQEDRTGEYQDTDHTGTSPTRADTDGDGLTDDFEIAQLDFGYDPNIDDSAEDFDEDFLTTAEELALGTDVLKDDTDEDTLLDGDELNTGIYVDETNTGTNPLLKDTDGDGYNDNIEVPTGVFVSTDDPGTNPNLADSDGDGLPDGVEKNTGINNGPTDPGTNPNSADTDGDDWLDGIEIEASTDPNLKSSVPTSTGIPDDMIEDLNASVGVTTDTDEISVTEWENLSDLGGDDLSLTGGSGDPQLLSSATPTGQSAIAFTTDDRLVGDDDSALDTIIQGNGLTWIAVIRIPDNQGAGVPNGKNRIFGTLTNETPFSGYMANIDNDEVLGADVRPGPAVSDTFFIDGSTSLNDGIFKVLSGRLTDGTGEQLHQIYSDLSLESSGFATISDSTNSGPLTLGAERTGGSEYGDFDLARLLIYDRPLTGLEWNSTILELQATYIGSSAPSGFSLSSTALTDSTLSLTITGGDPDTTYSCLSSTDLLDFTTTEATDPAVITTNEAGAASFTISTNGRTKLFLRVESSP